MPDLTAGAPPATPPTPWYGSLWKTAQDNALPQAALIGLLSMIPPLFASSRQGRQRMQQGWGNLGANLALQTALQPGQERRLQRQIRPEVSPALLHSLASLARGGEEGRDHGQ